MGFDVAAGAYDRFMGRFSEPLADEVADLLDLRPGLRALDVGSGPGALTARLVGRLGAGAVAAVDPSRSFVAALRRRLPGVDARVAPAERLPFGAGSFDRAAAQLVVPFLADPPAGLREMRRVLTADGLLVAAVWDHAGGAGPLEPFWAAAREVDPSAPDESADPGVREGDLERLVGAAGFEDVRGGSLTVTVALGGFAAWWDPFTEGVGPAGAYVAGLDAPTRTAVRDRCAERLGPGPFEVRARAWCVTARG
jgi:SAM-dependent methyltransferase